jgi:hypothetical protein
MIIHITFSDERSNRQGLWMPATLHTRDTKRPCCCLMQSIKTNQISLGFSPAIMTGGGWPWTPAWIMTSPAPLLREASTFLARRLAENLSKTWTLITEPLAAIVHLCSRAFRVDLVLPNHLFVILEGCGRLWCQKRLTLCPNDLGFHWTLTLECSSLLGCTHQEGAKCLAPARR